MRDDVSRELERRQDESPDERAEWLRALVAEGRIRETHVTALAATGDPGAALIAKDREPNLIRFLADVAACSSGVRPFFVALAAVIVDLHKTLDVQPSETTLSSLEDWFDLLGKSKEGADALAGAATKIIGEFARSLSPLVAAIGLDATPSGLAAAWSKANPDSLLAAAKKAVEEWALSGGETLLPLEWLRAEQEAGRLLPPAPKPDYVPMAPPMPNWEDIVAAQPAHGLSPLPPLPPLPPIMSAAENEEFMRRREELMRRRRNILQTPAPDAASFEEFVEANSNLYPDFAAWLAARRAQVPASDDAGPSGTEGGAAP